MKLTLRVFFLALFALSQVGCEKCVQEEPLVKVTFYDKDTDTQIFPEFDRVYSPSINSNYKFKDLGRIPLDLSSNQTTFVFEKAGIQDTISISYETVLNNSTNGYCIDVKSENLTKSTFDIRCYKLRSNLYFFGSNYCNEAELYEIQVYY